MSVKASETKMVMVIQPTAIVDSASWATVEVDTLGWEYATFYFAMGANDIATTVLKMQESDTSGSGMADVTGLVFGTSLDADSGSASTLPSATDDNTIVAMDVDLKARKRYLDPVVTNGNGTLGGYMTAWCVLSRGHTVPVSGTDRGLGQLLRV